MKRLFRLIAPHYEEQLLAVLDRSSKRIILVKFDAISDLNECKSLVRSNANGWSREAHFHHLLSVAGRNTSGRPAADGRVLDVAVRIRHCAFVLPNLS